MLARGFDRTKKTGDCDRHVLKIYVLAGLASALLIVDQAVLDFIRFFALTLKMRPPVRPVRIRLSRRVSSLSGRA